MSKNEAFSQEGAMAVCRLHQWPEDRPEEVIVPEPYLPFVPRDWNGVLVLAESQHLAGKNRYRERLDAYSSDQRILRLLLQDEKGHVGVGPWDEEDAIIKLALKAMLPAIRTEQVAVGNAVPWSREDSKGRNANPSKLMQQASVEFWRDLWGVWSEKPRVIFPLGRIARNVTEKADLPNRIPLRLPSPNNINRICGMFNKDDLLRRYPEVRQAGKDLGVELKLSNVFFACHALSLGKNKFQELDPDLYEALCKLS